MTERDETTMERIGGSVSRRRFIGMGGLAVGAVALGACGGDEADGGGDDGGSTDTTAAGGVPTTSVSDVTVGYNNPNRMLRSPLYVAQSLGYFEEVGITNLTINDADDPVPPMIAGEYEIALFDSDVLFDGIDNGVLQAKMVSINLGAQPLILLAAPGFETADLLEGARVGGGRAGQVNEALCKFMLQEIGLDWQNDVQFTELTGGSNDWVQALLTGQIDATIAFARHIPLVANDEFGGSVLYNDFLPAPQGGFAMNDDFMAENPSFAAAWNHAYIKAHRFVKDFDNFDEVVRILNEDHGIDLPDAFFDDAVREIDGTLLTQDLGFDPAEMDTWMEFVAPFGNVAPDINDRWRDMVDVSGLHVAQEALGLPLNPSADLSTGEEKIDNF